MSLALRSIGAPLDRVDGPLKVTGAAKYAYEYRSRSASAYAFPVQSTIAKGRIADDSRDGGAYRVAGRRRGDLAPQCPRRWSNTDDAEACDLSNG